MPLLLGVHVCDVEITVDCMNRPATPPVVHLKNVAFPPPCVCVCVFVPEGHSHCLNAAHPHNPPSLFVPTCPILPVVTFASPLRVSLSSRPSTRLRPGSRFVLLHSFIHSLQ